MHVLRFYFVKLFFPKNLLFKNIFQTSFLPLNRTHFKVSFMKKKKKRPKCHLLHFYFVVGQIYYRHFYFLAKILVQKLHYRNLSLIYVHRQVNLPRFLCYEPLIGIQAHKHNPTLSTLSNAGASAFS